MRRKKLEDPNDASSPAQLLLPFTRRQADSVGTGSEEQLRERLDAVLSGRLASLVLTRNRSTFLTTETERDLAGRPRHALRLHRVFLDAPDDVLEMVAVFVSSRRRATRSRALAVLREYFGQAAPDDERQERRTTLRSRGNTYDLAQILSELNRRYFGDRLDPAITWGRWQRIGRRRRSCQLGSYSREGHLIRIHPVLDSSEVPRFVVAAVVHHEMLHADEPAVAGGLRRRVHTPEFRRREREFEELAAATEWIGTELFALLRRLERRPRAQ